MQVIEMLNEGLKREIKVLVPAEDLEARLTDRLVDAKNKVKLKGFRLGKVPASHLRKIYGKSFMVEIINEILDETPHSILAERGERFATQPKIKMSGYEREVEKIFNGKADFVFSLNYEILPKIELKDVSAIEVTREVIEISKKQVNEQIKRILSSTRTYTEKKSNAEDGDQITIDYLGRLGDESFEGGTGSDAQLILGDKIFIPGFEEQLVGTKVGDEIQIEVVFPEDYEKTHLAGKEATFDIKVKRVAKPNELKIDDEAAKKIGLESLARLREVVREQLKKQYDSVTRQKIKRQILDALDKDYQFDIPEQLVEVEFNNIWSQINVELKQAGRTFEDEKMTQEDAREEYRSLAERRVRLGLVLCKIGEEFGVTVSDEELQRAIYTQVRQYPRQEKEIFEFFRRTPEAVANLRVSIFEEKVIDDLLGKVKLSDKQVTLQELMAKDKEDIAVAKK
ncbi:MAG: trigger factor [Candidatus Tokpelaia sp. JSC189]|nr:MAG: trigger factor [Candidatus Tokpelaia sp. JSC189]